MLSGAYSKTYKQIEKHQVDHLKQMAINDQNDAIARAKRLQQETNRRRKAQAVKRKLESQREEKRRQNILNKRREEQQEATEKFQRSHVSSRPSSKSSNSSGKRSPKNHRTLEETLKLVRGSLSGKHSSKVHRSPYSTQLYSTDPLNRPYINKYSGTYHHSTEKHSDSSNTNYLHNNSLRNLSNSRNLFEQQLEQHQQFLVDQQQRTLSEFNDAIKNEISKDRGVSGVDIDSDSQNLPRSDSLSSVDSLEESEDSLRRSCDLTDDKNVTQIQKSEQRVNGFNLKSNINGVQDEKTGVRVPHPSPVNVVRPHLNCQNIQFQLDHEPSDMYKNNQLESQNKKIDSYDINQIGPTAIENGLPDTKPVAERPKVQLRAWATPSPVDSTHRQQPEPASQNSQRMVSNSGLYTQRNTMTTVTTTTAYVKGTSQTGPQYSYMNGETEKPTFINGVPLQPPVAHVQNQIESPKTNQMGKNLEFLETVTNGLGSDRSDKIENQVSSKIPKESPPSRVPRPVTVVKKIIPSKQIATPSAPTVTPTSTQPQPITSAKTASTLVSQPIVVLSVSKADNKENESASNESTSPKFQLVSGGKLAVLPDKPVMPQPVRKTSKQPQQTTSKQATSAPTQKSKDDSELETVSKAKLKDMESGLVKGILKRPETSQIPTLTMKRAGSTGSMNIKDSLEVAKSQMYGEKPKPAKKKSVRFADVQYSDMDDSEEENDKLFTKRISVHITPKKRAFSAKGNLQTTETEISTKAGGRGSSASERLASQKHKSTIRPQAAAHIITHNPPTGSKDINQNESKRISLVNNNFMSKVPVSNIIKQTISQIQPVSSDVTMYTVPGARLNYAVSSTVVTPQKQENFPNGYYQQPTVSNSTPEQGVTNGVYQEGPVYDENGMRIDRTPTDDEINFLWDKVRTCLQRTPAPANSPVSDSGRPQFFEQPVSRQAAPVSHTIIDGAALGKIAAQARVSNYANPNNSNGRKSIDPNGYQRKYGLLSRQKQQNPNSLNKNNSQQPRQIITYHGPMSSNLEPQQGNIQYQPRQENGDSMTAFLMAEQLAQQSISDSQMHNTLNDIQTKPISATRPAPNVPSALSIEERRILESLDKLNEQLKISEFPGPLPQQAPPPQPIQPPVQQHYVHTGGFRGHHPIQQRRNSGVTRKMSPHSPTIQNIRFS